MLAETQDRVGDPKVGVPLTPSREPLVEEARRVIGTAEVLHLHLLELARAEDEVPRRDLVAERLPDLRDAEREPPSRRLLDVLEVDEDALRRLGTQPRDRRGVLSRPDERLEHEVEAPRVGKLLLATVRTGNARQLDLVRSPGIHKLLAVLQLVDPVTLPA